MISKCYFDLFAYNIVEGSLSNPSKGQRSEQYQEFAQMSCLNRSDMDRINANRILCANGTKVLVHVKRIFRRTSSGALTNTIICDTSGLYCEKSLFIDVSTKIRMWFGRL